MIKRKQCAWTLLTTSQDGVADISKGAGWTQDEVKPRERTPVRAEAGPLTGIPPSQSGHCAAPRASGYPQEEGRWRMLKEQSN